MNPKQKRAYNRARRALLELAREVVGDAEAENDALYMMCHTSGSMMATLCATRGSTDDLHRAISVGAKVIESAAIETFAQCLAAERDRAGRVN